MSPRWLLVLIVIWLLNIPVNNWLEGDDFITSAQEATFNTANEYEFDSSVDSSGLEALNVSKTKSSLETLFDAVSFNYTFFYDIDPVTGDQEPNEFMYIRWFLIAMSFVTIIFTVKTIFFSV